MGNYEEAKEYYLKALNIFEKELWRNHPDTATTYSNLAYLLQNMGSYEEAKEYHFKAYNSLEKTEHYFKTFQYFIEYLKMKNLNKNISIEICDAIKMLETIDFFYQKKDLLNQAFLTIEPIFDKANLSDIRCKEKYEKYKKYIEQVRVHKLQNDEDERLKDDNSDGL